MLTDDSLTRSPRRASRAPAGTTGRQDPGQQSPSTPAASSATLGLPSIAAPKGGGAIQGIDAKFASNAATGTAGLTIPVATSPGRAGFQLGLALAYDSGSGNGPFGLGWRLAVPSITRKTDVRLPLYRDGRLAEPDSDVFVAAGAEDLVPERSIAAGGFHERVDGDYRVRRYRPRVEAGFARTERWTHEASGDVHWRTTSGDNTTSVFGLSRDARIADPDDCRRVFSWLLEETRDDRGNVVRYAYKGEDGAGVQPAAACEAHRFDVPSDATTFSATAQRYLKRVFYGNRRPGDASDWLFEVVLDYGEHEDDTPVEVRPWDLRPDPFSSYRSGFEIRTYRLCRRVLMFHRFAELGPDACLVRSTDVVFERRDHLTTLARVIQVGYQREDGAQTYSRATLPPVDLTYALREVHHAVRTLEPPSLEGIPDGAPSRYGQWVDLDGEGIPGVLLENPRAWYYKANLGSGRLAPPAPLRTLPSPAELRTGVQQLVDLEGEGQMAVVGYTPPFAGYFGRTRDGGWEPFTPFRSVPNIDWQSPNLRVLDLDGDGHPDVLLSEDDLLVWYRSRTKEGFDDARLTARPKDESEGPAVVFSNRTEAILLADMSGDGLVDIVRVRSSEVSYWPNLGYGRFGRKIVMAHCPRFDAVDLFDAGRVRLGDIDGSGTTDLIYLGRDGVRLYFNESGNRLSEGTTLSLPLPHTLASVSVVDVLGNGTACLVWASPTPGDGATPLVYVDLMGGKKPHLLTGVANNFGGETKVFYGSSTTHYLRDKLAGRRWITRLPFPVHVVDRVERHDHVTDTKLVTRFCYHDGFYDGVEREYRGFAHVEQWDAESFAGGHELQCPPVRTETWFHTGALLGDMRLEDALAPTYYRDAAAAPSPSSSLPDGLSAPERREAMRALRGRVLRQQIHAEDGAPEAPHPYSVSERSYVVRLLQHACGQNHAVFFVHPLEQRDYAYERQPQDPRIAHQVTLEVDDFGNVLQSASVAYPRRQAGEPEQAKPWATLSDRTVANWIDSDVYRIGTPVVSESAELTGLEAGRLLDVDEVRTFVRSAGAIAYEAVPSGSPERRLLARERVTYYRDDLSGPLPLGEIGRRALPFETAKQAFSKALLTSTYEEAIDDDLLSIQGGYRKENDVWWTLSGRLLFDPAAFYQPVAAIDPFGARSEVRYDSYAVLAVETKDALGNTTTTGRRDETGNSTYDGNDYRALAPWLVTDANLNRVAGVYDALGMPVRIARMGKVGAGEGDTLDDPTVRIEYDLHRWAESRGARPIVVRSLAREEHGTANTRWQESYSYVDGFAGEAMRKVQAEPGPVPVRRPDGGLARDQDGQVRTRVAERRWVGTGRTVVDNKGNPVKKYEPFFSDTFEYETERELVEWGVTPIMRYDPLGRLVRTDLPNGTYRKIEFHAWTQTTWDENDNVLDSAWFAERGAPDPGGPGPHGDRRRRAAWLAAQHAGTPARAHLDALGRAFLAEEDNRDAAGAYRTRTVLDISGNTLAVIDARNVRTVDGRIFDMLGRVLQTRSADAGWIRTLADVASNPLRTWDARGFTKSFRYDELRRPTHVFVQSGSHADALVSRVVYGERHPTALERNLRTRPFRTYDGAGVSATERFDFEGNATETTRTLALDHRTTPDWSRLADLREISAFEEAASELLETEVFASTTRYDALGRVALSVSPDRSETRPSYNEASLLERMEVRIRGASGWTPFVADVDYDARGQKMRCVYGNGMVSTYEYERETFRLRRLGTAQRDGIPLQDRRYEYDPAGNVVQIDDEVSFGNPAVRGDGLYEYDPLYRLVRADGREHPSERVTSDDAECLDFAHPNDFARLRRYREIYAYDAVGNIERIKHLPSRGPEAGWVRLYEYEAGCNRLVATGGPSDRPGLLAERYTYDAHGNMTAMPHLQTMRWDYADRLAYCDRGGGGKVYFTYDGGGQRVRKVCEHGGLVEERIYLGSYEIYRKRLAGSSELAFERETLHVPGSGRRVALVETKTVDRDAATLKTAPRLRFQVENHLESTAMEVDETGAVVSYEEYLPYGATALRARGQIVDAPANRYRYTGKERDEETGLYYHGARYYAAWLGRWTTVDPAQRRGEDGQRVDQPYVYVQNRPLVAIDPDGRILWFLVAGIVLVATLTAASPANAPENKQQAARAQPRISDAEFAVHTTVVGISFAVGGGTGNIILKGTGSKVLAGAIGGGYSGLAAPADVAVHDAFRGELSSGQQYASATLFGVGGGLALGGLFGLGSRIVGGPAPTPALASETRILGAQPLLPGEGTLSSEQVVLSNKQAWAELTQNAPSAKQIFEPGQQLSGVDELALIAHGGAKDEAAMAAAKIGAEYVNIEGVGKLGPQELAELLKNSGWQGGHLRLIACSTGLPPAEGEAFGELLSQALGERGVATVVAAPKGLVQVGSPGLYGTAAPVIAPPLPATLPEGAAGIGAFNYYGPAATTPVPRF